MVSDEPNTSTVLADIMLHAGISQALSALLPYPLIEQQA